MEYSWDRIYSFENNPAIRHYFENVALGELPIRILAHRYRIKDSEEELLPSEHSSSQDLANDRSEYVRNQQIMESQTLNLFAMVQRLNADAADRYQNSLESEIPEPEVPEPEISEPEIPEPEIPESGIPEPEIPEPEIPEPEIPEPEIPEPEIPEPEVPEPEIPEPEVSEPEIPEPEVPVSEEETEAIAKSKPRKDLIERLYQMSKENPSLLNSKLIDLVTAEELQLLVNEFKHASGESLPLSLTPVLVQQIVQGIIAKRKFEREQLVEILSSDHFHQIREIILKYEQRLHRFLGTLVRYKGLELEIAPICERGPVTVEMLKEDAPHSGEYASLQEFSDRVLLAKQVECDLTTADGCSHDHHQWLVWSTGPNVEEIEDESDSEEDLQPTSCSHQSWHKNSSHPEPRKLDRYLTIRNAYGESAAIGLIRFQDDFYDQLESTSTIPEEMLAELMAICPTYQYKRGWDWSGLGRNSTNCTHYCIQVNVSGLDEYGSSFTPTAYLYRNNIEMRINQYHFAKEHIPDSPVENRTTLQYAKFVFETYFRLTGDASYRMKFTNSGLFRYSREVAIVDIHFLLQIFRCLPGSILVKYKAILPDLDLDWRSSNRDNQKLREICDPKLCQAMRQGMAPKKLEGYKFALQQEEHWITTRTGVLRNDIYIFLARIFTWECDGFYHDMISHDPITLIHPAPLQVINDLEIETPCHQSNLKQAQLIFETYFQMTQDIKRAVPTNDGQFCYPHRILITDLNLLVQVLRCIPPSILLKYQQFFPLTDVIVNSNRKLEFEEVMAILCQTTDLILDDHETTAEEFRERFGVPVERPKSWGLVLRHQEQWISTKSYTLQWNLYAFLARIFIREFDGFYLDILTKEPITYPVSMLG